MHADDHVVRPCRVQQWSEYVEYGWVSQLPSYGRDES